LFLIKPFLIDKFDCSFTGSQGQGVGIQHHGKSINPTEKFPSINLFRILCIVIWAESFLTSEYVETVRGQAHPSEVKNGMKELIY